MTLQLLLAVFFALSSNAGLVLADLAAPKAEAAAFSAVAVAYDVEAQTTDIQEIVGAQSHGHHIAVTSRGSHGCAPQRAPGLDRYAPRLLALAAPPEWRVTVPPILQAAPEPIAAPPLPGRADWPTSLSARGPPSA